MTNPFTQSAAGVIRQRQHAFVNPPAGAAVFDDGFEINIAESFRFLHRFVGTIFSEAALFFPLHDQFAVGVVTDWPSMPARKHRERTFGQSIRVVVSLQLTCAGNSPLPNCRRDGGLCDAVFVKLRQLAGIVDVVAERARSRKQFGEVFILHLAKQLVVVPGVIPSVRVMLFAFERPDVIRI